MRSKTRSEKLNRERAGLGILGQVDFPFLMITLCLVAYGLVMVFSASYYYSISVLDNPFAYLIRDGAWVAMGLVAMAFATLLNYRFYEKVAPFVIIICIVALALIFTPLGVTRNGATRWLGVGGLTVMPGEWAKMGVIMFTAWFYGARKWAKENRASSLLRGILPELVVVGAIAFMIMKQPNLSTAITVCGIAVCMMLVAGMKWRYFWGVAAAGAGGLVFILTAMKGSYWYSRIVGFTNPFDDFLGEGYQVAQSLLALGSGGFFGVGLGKSVQKTLYLPEPQNDFILAIIGEETGYLGLILLLMAYCYFIWRGIRIALNAPDQFSMLLASGIVCMVAIQVILNIAVVTASMPPTGINLPFISYGGNGLLIFMFCAGIMLNISRYASPPQKRERNEVIE